MAGYQQGQAQQQQARQSPSPVPKARPQGSRSRDQTPPPGQQREPGTPGSQGSAAAANRTLELARKQAKEAKAAGFPQSIIDQMDAEVEALSKKARAKKGLGARITDAQQQLEKANERCEKAQRQHETAKQRLEEAEEKLKDAQEQVAEAHHVLTEVSGKAEATTLGNRAQALKQALAAIIGTVEQMPWGQQDEVQNTVLRQALAAATSMLDEPAGNEVCLIDESGSEGDAMEEEDGVHADDDADDEAEHPDAPYPKRRREHAQEGGHLLEVKQEIVEDVTQAAVGAQQQAALGTSEGGAAECDSFGRVTLRP